MSSGVRAMLLALIVLAIGLGTVYLEVETLESGVRVRQLLLEEERLRERNRRREAEINRRFSPDVLALEVPPEFRETSEAGDAEFYGKPELVP